MSLHADEEAGRLKKFQNFRLEKQGSGIPELGNRVKKPSYRS